MDRTSSDLRSEINMESPNVKQISLTGDMSPTTSNDSKELYSDLVESWGKQLDSNANHKATTRTIKVGKRVFEVTTTEKKNGASLGSTNVLETLSKRLENNNQYYQSFHENAPKVDEPLIYEEPIARRVKRRKRKKFRPTSSVISLPMSSVTAFSGFTAMSTTSSIRPKRSKTSLLLNSFIMFGREFCYAIEASLTTPILLSIGLPMNLYSLVWVISPILGFILQPIIGSMSDKCRTRWGRRRPFILILSILLMFGLTFFLNGEQFVNYFANGDSTRQQNTTERQNVLGTILVTVMGVVIFDFSADFIEGPIRAYVMDVCDEEDVKLGLFYQAVFTGFGGALGYASGGVSWVRDLNFGVYFPTDKQVVYVTAAVVFLVCLALNLTSIPEKNRILEKKLKRKSKLRPVENVSRNHRGRQAKESKLQTDDNNNNAQHKVKRTPKQVSIMSKDNERSLRSALTNNPQTRRTARQRDRQRRLTKAFYGTFNGSDPDQIHAYLAQRVLEDRHGVDAANSTEISNVNANKFATKKTSKTRKTAANKSFPASTHKSNRFRANMESETDSDIYMSSDSDIPQARFGSRRRKEKDTMKRSLESTSVDVAFEEYDEPYLALPAPKYNNSSLQNEINNDQDENVEQEHGIKTFFKSIVGMPKEIKQICIAHLLGWMGFLCVVLFFTDFVGQEVFGGDPQEPLGTEKGDAYKMGVEIGSWGMTINAAASCLYCFLLKPMIQRFGARPVYMFGYFAFSFGALGMAIFPNMYCVLILSSLIGVMSATLYTLPYFLVAQYHEGYKKFKGTAQERGVGTDCALVTCMIQLAQIIVGLGIGALVVWLDTVTVTVVAGSISSLLGTIWVTFWVTY